MGAEVEGDTLGDEVNSEYCLTGSTEHYYRYVHVISFKKSKFSCKHAGGQCCGSGCLSRIPDSKTAMKEKKSFVIPLFWSHKFHKIVTKLTKIWVWDPGSGKNLFRIPDPGVKRAPDPGSPEQHSHSYV
jgi:hypothetical protein